MSDAAVAGLLRSDAPLVVIEAAAGCGKTYQGAAYAQDIVGTLGEGRLLILTHTHAACDVFADRTRGARSRVEIKTIDALIMQIATAYHLPLELPRDLGTWAWQDNGRGFELMAAKVAVLLRCQPMIARALARRYPVIICDEHQDCTLDRHAIVMALHDAGAALRIFGDPMQRIFGEKTEKAARTDRERWNALKASGASDKLETPHRWDDGCPLLGDWIQRARSSLNNGEPIDLGAPRPPSVRVIIANNMAQARTGYQLSGPHRAPIDRLVREADQLMVLASQNDLVAALCAFWNRRIPIWEGHTRDALASLTGVLRSQEGKAEALAAGLVDFVNAVATGFGKAQRDRLVEEVRRRAARPTTGAPANLQAVARCLLDDPTHRGVASALTVLKAFVDAKAPGFDSVRIDFRREFNEATRFGLYPNADSAFAEIARRRSYARLSLPDQVLSSIHKAKGLECDHVLLMACDTSQFSRTLYARSKLYVALSRAKKSLTLVVPDTNPSALFKLP